MAETEQSALLDHVIDGQQGSTEQHEKVMDVFKLNPIVNTIASHPRPHPTTQFFRKNATISSCTVPWSTSVK